MQQSLHQILSSSMQGLEAREWEEEGRTRGTNILSGGEEEGRMRARMRATNLCSGVKRRRRAGEGQQT